MKLQPGTNLSESKQNFSSVNLRKIFSINHEVAVFLQRHQSETIEGMFKSD